MIVLGIDPGTATTGYGVIKKIRKKNGRNSFLCLDYGTISTPSELNNGERFRILSNKLSQIIKKYKPDVLAVEKLYFFKNQKTAVVVSEAKGVILLTGAKKRIPVFEFTPLEIKRVITGYGRANKKEVQEKIRRVLRLKEIPRPDDAADALAVAFCFLKIKKKNKIKQTNAKKKV